MNSSYDYEDDEDETNPGYQSLPVAKLPHDFNAEPQNGMEYLFTVRRDAQKLPSTTRVPNPYAVNGDNASIASSSTSMSGSPAEPPTIAPERPGSLPSDEWREALERNFKRLRENLQQATIHVDIPPQRRGQSYNIPPTSDRILWRAFLDGKPEKEWNPPTRSKRQQKRMGQRPAPTVTEEPPRKKVKVEQDGEDEGEVDMLVLAEEGEQEEASNVIIPREASMTYLSKLDGGLALCLLRSFTYWLNNRTPSPSDPTARTYPVHPSHARWIFSLLASLETHLLADDVHILRELTRACLGVIADSLTAESGGVAPWWIVVAAVVGTWGQRDLWMDAEALCRKFP